VLDGQGSDELLGGYRWMWSARIASLIRHGDLVGAWRQLRGTVPARGRYDPPTRDTALRAVAMCLPRAVSTTAQKILRRDVRPWASRAWVRRHGIVPVRPWWAGGYGREVLREALWMGATERSLPTLLRYEDRNSMAHSVEARLPFLTIPLAEFVLGLPEEYLVAPDASGKAIFRAAMRGLTPDEVLDRRDKVGFSVPIHAWISKLPILTELMEEAARLPCVDPHGLAPLMSRSNSGRSMLDVMLSHPVRDQIKYSFWVWRLAGLAGWVRQFGVEIDP
jgi:asparagine synthase (glutamine-hydrolysing)